MEFPHLGKHCSEPSCKQLDFLPIECDSCHKIFCNEHFTYNQHSCSEAYKKDNQVPVCPLCNIPIPVKKGEAPDLIVGRHIDADCQSDPAKERRGKIYTNRCSFKGCKAKELIPFNCNQCQKNFCIRHRNELDHDCKGFEDSGRGASKAAAAAVARQKMATSSSSTKSSTSKPQTTPLSSVGRDLDRERRDRQQQQQRGPAPNLRAMQANMSEDEAMAQALALSMADTPGPPKQTSANSTSTQQEEEDEALARAIALSEQDAANQQQRGQATKEKNCAVS